MNLKQDELNLTDNCVISITFNWTDSDDAKLITMIEANQALWDTSRSEYRDSNKKQRIYMNISTYFKGTTPLDIEKRFISLKEKYRREKKKLESTIRSGTAACNLREWHLMSRMSKIMEKIMKPRKFMSIEPPPQSSVSQDGNFSEETLNMDSIFDLASSSESTNLCSPTENVKAKCPTFTPRTNIARDKFFEEGTKALERISQSAESIVSAPKSAEKQNHFKVFEFMAEECSSMETETRNKFIKEVMDVFWKYKLD